MTICGAIARLNFPFWSRYFSSLLRGVAAFNLALPWRTSLCHCIALNVSSSRPVVSRGTTRAEATAVLPCDLQGALSYPLSGSVVCCLQLTRLYCPAHLVVVYIFITAVPIASIYRPLQSCCCNGDTVVRLIFETIRRFRNAS